jgi:hypothetical protein
LEDRRETAMRDAGGKDVKVARSDGKTYLDENQRPV